KTDVFARSDGLSDNHINYLFEDREGNFWVATSNGVDCFREFAVTTFSVDQGLRTNSQSVLASRDGNVWIASTGGVLNRWIGRSLAPAVVNGKLDGKLDGLPIGTLFQDDRGRIWVSTRGGIGRLENDRFAFIHELPGGDTYAIAQDSEKNVWVANREY